ncbi:MAG: TolC family protein [Gemmataceae bacterium]|nr:TolC family protein [Gemmataceae bacterium]
MLERPANFAAVVALLVAFTLVRPGRCQPQTLPSLSHGPATAVPGTPALSRPIGLADLIGLSLEQNPGLRQAEFDIEAARGRAVQAGLYPNPRLSVNAEEVGGRQGRGGIVTLPQVQQEIVTGGKLRLSQAVAEREVDQAGLALIRQRVTLLTAVRQGYFKVLAVRRRVEVLDDLIQLATQSYENAKKVLGAGEATKPDVYQFEIELERFRADREAARQDLAAAWRRLSFTMGTPNLPYHPLVGSLEAPAPVYEFDRAYEYLLTVHPELRSAEVGVTRAQFALRRAQAEPIPNVTVGGGYVANFNDRDNQFTYQVSVPLPLFNRNQGNIRTAQAELGRAGQEVSRVRNDLGGRLAAAFGQYAAARQRAERYRSTILPRARESYRLTLLAFRGGQFEYLRVLQAQRAVGEANLTYTQALFEQWRAASEVAGLLLEEDWPATFLQCAEANPAK